MNGVLTGATGQILLEFLQRGFLDKKGTNHYITVHYIKLHYITRRAPIITANKIRPFFAPAAQFEEKGTGIN